MIKLNELIKKEYRDACGIGFIAEMHGRPSRRVIELALKALKRMAHRGAFGADDKTSDGIGLLVEIPFNFFSEILNCEIGIKLKANNSLGIAMVFTSAEEEALIENSFIAAVAQFGIEYLGKRIVPTNPAVLGEIGKKTCPLIIQYFFGGTGNNKYDFETLLYLVRKKTEQIIIEKNGESFICSLSSRTIVYKGMIKTDLLPAFYPDLTDVDFTSRVALFHERFSTNTISTWSMAQPFRMLGHNGEINTIKANRLWMKTREATISSEFWGDNYKFLSPIVSQTGSDSYSFDNILEFLTKSGRSLLESAMMLIPEPYIFDNEMGEDLKNFYIYHENHIEPWDGPAAIVYTDGIIAGAKLDRNGLRPLRYTITNDGLVIMASEAGVVDITPENVKLHHHMKSGENFAMKLDGSGILSNEEIVSLVTRNGKYTHLIRSGLTALERGTVEEEFGDFAMPEGGFDKRLRVAFGFDKEDLERFIIPMSETGREPIGSMGDDTPPAVMSHTNRRLYDYFKQAFAQVTNPAIDPIRERHVMSLFRYIGSEENLLSDDENFRGAIRIESPVLSPREVKLLKGKYDWFPHRIVSCNAHINEDLKERIEKIKLECEEAARDGVKIIFLSDEGLSPENYAIPMLLAVSAVHQHLIDKKLRNNCALLCFSGNVVEDHHVACLIGFGASAVYPYMAYELIRENFKDENWAARMSNYRSALEKGLLKIMAKMGISTVSSYHGSMLFNGIGLSKELVNAYFPSIKSTLGGLGLDDVKRILSARIQNAFIKEAELEETGRFRFRKEGEPHGFSPSVFKSIHNISSGKNQRIDENAREPIYIRDLLTFVPGKAIEPDKVETEEEIIKRFGLGAISFGAISEEVHRALARAASILNIRSNTGEGGEQSDRYSITNPDGSENCYVKQIASGRFGVTTMYLSAAREIQIKIGQGAKPGEGGQLPAEKVTLSIANARNTTPGVPLISPPPHHDIYSIEDLAQLIYDLKQVNPRANVCVKLVSQFGIGLVASGVVKAGADVILISGNDGGTGASPLGSLKHTGLPWEIGLSEVHRTLSENSLRSKVILRVDGGLKKAKDVLIATALGAEEFDFGTAALVALGCVMARQCHLNTCPAGIATQDEKLRAKFKGKPENLVNYINYIAAEIRSTLASLGFDSISSLVGRIDKLTVNPEFKNYIAEKKIDLSDLLKYKEPALLYHTNPKSRTAVKSNFRSIDDEIIEEVRPAIMTHGRVTINRTIKNTDRSIGARLSGLISFLYGPGAFKGYIQFRLDGSAGQSLGAFLVENVEIRHCGVANDYVGKGMNGGLISIRFPREIRKALHGNTIIGNVALYGATGGELFVAGKAGERFAVRNSGAAAVVEGVGNHCCEYMTRGVVIVLGESGKNFGAGMTGGVAFLYNPSKYSRDNINRDYVRITKPESGDEDLLLKTLVNHQFHTGSPLAQRILNDWEESRRKFVKIVPLAFDSINFEAIYEEHYKKRIESVFHS